MSVSSVDQQKPAPWRHRLALVSPLLIIAVGHTVAVLFTRRLGPWAWLPLQIVYWLSLAAVSWLSGSLPALVAAYRQHTGWRWWALNLAVGVIPLPILLRNTPLLSMHTLAAFWLAIAVLNPILEETYWRGVLGLATSRWPLGLALPYTSVFFAAAHPLLWGVFSIANRSGQTIAALLMMGAVWHLTFRRTKGLQATTLSHCLVDLGNLTVWVFLNLYIPPSH